MIAQRHRGEFKGGASDTVTIGELLDDVLKSDITGSTRYVWKAVIEKNIRPFFGKIRAVKLTTDKMDAYREKRKGEERTDAAANREVSIVRTAFNNARKRAPLKVNVVPYFPMIEEKTIRQGYLADDVYDRLRDELPQYLKAIFVCAYETGMRKNERLVLAFSSSKIRLSVTAQ